MFQLGLHQLKIMQNFLENENLVLKEQSFEINIKQKYQQIRYLNFLIDQCFPGVYRRFVLPFEFTI